MLTGAAGLAGVLTLLPAEAFGQSPRKGVLKYATLGLDTSDPHRHTGSIAVQQAYVEASTSIAGNGAVEPFLAKSFEVPADGRTYTFHLHPNVTFHNGDTLTSGDVKANIERVKSKVKGGWLVTAMKLVEQIETPDATTLVVKLEPPTHPF